MAEEFGRFCRFTQHIKIGWTDGGRISSGYFGSNVNERVLPCIATQPTRARLIEDTPTKYCITSLIVACISIY